MRLRLRLALAFLLLSALPLAGLALYSYASSSKALRRAAEAEAELLARELELRVESVASNVDQRIRALARLPIEYWIRGEAAAEPVERQVLSDFAGALPFIEGLHFVPKTVAAPKTAPVPEGRPAPDAPVPPAGPAAEPLAAAIEAARPALAAVLGNGGKLTWTGDRDEVAGELAKIREAVARALAEIQKSSATNERDRQLVFQREATIARMQRQERRLEELAERDLRTAGVAAVPEANAVSPVAAVQAVPPAAPAKPFPKDVSCSVKSGDEVVGELKAKIKAKELLRSVLAQTDRAQGEIPFALDDDDVVYVAKSEDSERLRHLPALVALRATDGAPQTSTADEWVVVTRKDPATGYRFGIAKPLSDAMAELKAATARNFAYGLALIGLAVVGMVPVSSGLVKNVRRLEEGATRIAAGDLATRVPVTSRDEFGHLATTFNRMAEQLSEHQRRLVEQERLDKQREVERALLAAQNERRGRELEEARQFQISLLPRQLPEIPGFEIGVAMTTATEVGGDYYDVQIAPDGDLLLAVGDATGHGAAAGTMVTAVKSLFMAGAAGQTPADFLASANGVIHRMGLYRMAMALVVGRLSGRTLTLSSAGMPPALHFRASTGKVEEIVVPGTPLGARAEFPYAEAAAELGPGDALLLGSDGFAELPNSAGEPFGYERAREAFAACAALPAAEAVTSLRAAATAWTGGAAPCDDVTFLVLRATGAKREK